MSCRQPRAPETGTLVHGLQGLFCRTAPSVLSYCSLRTSEHVNSRSLRRPCSIDSLSAAPNIWSVHQQYWKTSSRPWIRRGITRGHTRGIFVQLDELAPCRDSEPFCSTGVQNNDSIMKRGIGQGSNYRIFWPQYIGEFRIQTNVLLPIAAAPDKALGHL
jgi:hypothetical protein